MRAALLFIFIVSAFSASAFADTQDSYTLDEIPDWIKNTALYYGQGDITDQEFINAIQFLIDNEIITTQATNHMDQQDKTIHYYHSEEKFTDNNIKISDHTKQIIDDSVIKAIENYAENNTNLNFVESKIPFSDSKFAENPNTENLFIEIKWHKYVKDVHVGLATCEGFDEINNHYCIVDVYLGEDDCNENYVQQDVNAVTEIIMHEIGHTLGLNHHSDENHLMYGDDEFVELQFNTLGYNIPEQLDNFYIGQKSLIPQEEKLDTETKQLEEKLSYQEIQYDNIYSQYQLYTEKTLSEQEYNEAIRLYEKLIIEENKLDATIEEYNQLVEKQTLLINKMNCFPNTDDAYTENAEKP